MEYIPFEILREVFRMACVDGGYTGCSLSQTSKAVREASATSRFQYIALSTRPRNLHSFLALYSREKKLGIVLGRKCKILTLHLYPELAPPPRLSRIPRREAESIPHSDAESDSSYYNGGRSSPSDLPMYSGIVTVRRLLDVVADDLKTFILTDVAYAQEGVCIFSKPLSLLERITLVDPDGYSLLKIRKRRHKKRVATVLFPSLTHVRIIPDWDRVPLFKEWAMHAPNATHLHITSLALQSWDNVLRVSELIGTSLAVGGPVLGEPNVAERPIWPSLRRIAITVKDGSGAREQPGQPNVVPMARKVVTQGGIEVQVLETTDPDPEDHYWKGGLDVW